MSTNINNMSAPSGGGEFGDPALGAHYSRFVGFAYMGVHERKAYRGQAKAPCGKVLMTFELLDDFIEIDGVKRPRWVSKKENAFNTSNSNVTKIYNTLDPTGQFGGDFAGLVNATLPCLINIAPKKDANGAVIPGTRIDSIGACPALPPGQELPAVQNPTFIFDFDNPTLESWAALKPWMRRMAQEAQDYPGSQCEAISKQYDAQQAATQGQQVAAPAAPAAGTQAPPPPPPAAAAPAQAPAAQAPAAAAVAAPPAPPALPAAAPVEAPAAAPAMPAAPPGFRYDAASNTFVPDAAAPAAPAGGAPY